MKMLIYYINFLLIYQSAMDRLFDKYKYKKFVNENVNILYIKFVNESK